LKTIKVNKLHTFTGHDAAVYALINGFDQHSILSGGADKIVTAWDIDLKLNTNFAVKLASGIYSLCWLEQKKILAIGTINGQLHIVDTVKREEIKAIKLHQGGIFSLLFDTNQQRLISASADGHIKAIDINTWENIASVKLSENKLRKIILDDIRKELYVSSSDGLIYILDSIDFKVKFYFIAHQLGSNCIALHPNKRFMLTGGRDAYINIWDMEMNYKMIKAIPAHNFAIYDLQFSPDTQLFASASRDKTFKIWNTEYLEFLLRIDQNKYDGHVNSVNSLVWKSNTQLVSTGDDRSIMLWEIASES
jgi:WD repeat-containing protein 61